MRALHAGFRPAVQAKLVGRVSIENTNVFAFQDAVLAVLAEREAPRSSNDRTGPAVVQAPTPHDASMDSKGQKKKQKRKRKNSYLLQVCPFQGFSTFQLTYAARCLSRISDTTTFCIPLSKSFATCMLYQYGSPTM